MKTCPHMSTVQTFNYCASWPDVGQCLVVQTVMNNMSKDKPETSMTHVALKSTLRSVVRSGTCGRIHAPGTGRQSDERLSNNFHLRRFEIEQILCRAQQHDGCKINYLLLHDTCR